MKLRVLGSLLLLAIAALGAEVDGKWTGAVNTPNGDFPVAFTFKADGANLTGSTSGPDGSEVAIKEGKVDGKNITFKVTFDFGGMPFTLNYKGVVDGDKINMTGDAMGQPIQFVVSKAK
jgi:hypothetical protein